MYSVFKGKLPKSHLIRAPARRFFRKLRRAKIFFYNLLVSPFFLIGGYLKDDFPVLILLGQSGVGKTTLAIFLEFKYGYMHIEADNKSSEGSNKGFTQFKSGKVPSVFLIHRAKKAAKASGYDGVVVSFSSSQIFSTRVHLGLERMGVRVVYLISSRQNCIEYFSKREYETGRGLSVMHWNKYNHKITEAARIRIDIIERTVDPFRKDGGFIPVARIAGLLLHKSSQ